MGPSSEQRGDFCLECQTVATSSWAASLNPVHCDDGSARPTLASVISRIESRSYVRSLCSRGHLIVPSKYP